MPATQQLYQLPDGSYAVLLRQMSWGETIIILLLAAMLFLQVYALWLQRH